jgi:hypothetical protein
MRFLSYLVTLLVAVLLSSCGGGGGSPGAVQGSGSGTDLFTTAPTDLTLTLGNAQSYTISGGTTPYTAVSADTSVAVAGVAGSGVTLGGVKPGVTKVTLRDAKGVFKDLNVTVKAARDFFTTAPSNLTLAIGNSNAQTYQLGGGVPPYSVVSTSPNTVVASFAATAAGGDVTITGLAAGNGSIVMRDSLGGSFTTAVTVAPASTVALFTTAPGATTIAVKASTSYSIGGGTGPYTVTSSNESVATVVQNGSGFTIRGVAPGVATVVIRDTVGNTVSIAVTVTNTQLSLNPSKSNSFIGDINYAYIIGGVGPYTALSAFPAAATVSVGTLSTTTGVFTPDTNGNVLKIVANQAVDPDQIVVTDSVGNSANYALSATAGTTQMSLIPGSLVISACYSGDVTLLLYGSTGAVNVFSSDTTVFSAAVTSPNSNPVVVTATKLFVDPTLSGTTSITAIDASGSAAVATITVVPSLLVCPP